MTSLTESQTPSAARRAVLAVVDVAISLVIVVLIVVAVVRTAFGPRAA
jgi:hypothetical protein